MRREAMSADEYNAIDANAIHAIAALLYTVHSAFGDAAMPPNDLHPNASNEACIDACWEAPASGEPALVLPDGCIDVIERDGMLFVVGAMTRAITVPVSRTPIRGIRFRPGHVRSWLHVSAHELTDTRVEAAAIPALRDARTLSDVVRLANQQPRRNALGEAIRRLTRMPNRRVADVAAEVGVGVRQLRRAFHQEVGLSPKTFARVQRLQCLRSAMGAPHQHHDLTRLALDAGYADQAHMSREVKALSGVTPLALRRTLSDSFNTRGQAVARL